MGRKQDGLKAEERRRLVNLLFLRSGQYCSCFYLGITRTEAFFMVSNASYPDLRSMAFSRSVVLRCLSSTNIMLSLCSHVSILC